MLAGRIDPIDLDVQAIIDDELSPQARSRVLAQAAREELARAEDINARVLGGKPEHTTTVDGVAGASEERVRPDGTIVYEFNLQRGLFAWIAAELEAFAPVLSGLFAHSFLFFVDGVLTELADEVPEGEEYVFMSSVPYAGKIEGENRAPESAQAPNGVFEAVATLAQRQFPGAEIAFSYRQPFAAAASGQPDTPAITIRRG
ncbi:hypothetical protein [Bradyrhizobium sp. SZCCHNRI2049]|uniref:hypothetical protein n=1 Tax=Bradyrhizobium sp. SZCCHNRI2049 TaxID=3057287 RepID=UPI00291635BA|nr:hypothetical protein [Bradyrhizobium sp. SZCCHNRI2049]